MKVPNRFCDVGEDHVSLSRLQNEGSQLFGERIVAFVKSIKATE